MGILQAPGAVPKTPAATKRKSGLDFSALKPLTTTGTRNFAGYRDPNASPTKKSKGGKIKNEDDMDSDADDDDDVHIGAADDDIDIKTESKDMLSPEDVARQGELAEGVRKIKVRFPQTMPSFGKFSPQLLTRRPAQTRPLRRPRQRRLALQIASSPRLPPILQCRPLPWHQRRRRTHVRRCGACRQRSRPRLQPRRYWLSVQKAARQPAGLR